MTHNHHTRLIRTDFKVRPSPAGKVSLTALRRTPSAVDPVHGQTTHFCNAGRQHIDADNRDRRQDIALTFSDRESPVSIGVEQAIARIFNRGSLRSAPYDASGRFAL